LLRNFNFRNPNFYQFKFKSSISFNLGQSSNSCFRRLSIQIQINSNAPIPAPGDWRKNEAKRDDQEAKKLRQEWFWTEGPGVKAQKEKEETEKEEKEKEEKEKEETEKEETEKEWDKEVDKELENLQEGDKEQEKELRNLKEGSHSAASTFEDGGEEVRGELVRTNSAGGKGKGKEGKSTGGKGKEGPKWKGKEGKEGKDYGRDYGKEHRKGKGKEGKEYYYGKGSHFNKGGAKGKDGKKGKFGKRYVVGKKGGSLGKRGGRNVRLAAMRGERSATTMRGDFVRSATADERRLIELRHSLQDREKLRFWGRKYRQIFRKTKLGNVHHLRVSMPSAAQYERYFSHDKEWREHNRWLKGEYSKKRIQNQFISIYFGCVAQGRVRETTNSKSNYFVCVAQGRVCETNNSR
jgi:hypothetical protein